MKTIKKKFGVLITAICLKFIFHPVGVIAQGRIWFAEINAEWAPEQQVTANNHSFNNTGVYGYAVNVNNGGKHIAAILQFTRMPVDVSQAGALTVRAHSLNSLYFGLRYYPMLPNFRIGTRFAVRLTFGAMGGVYYFYFRQKQDFLNNWDLKWTKGKFDPLLFAGLCLSPFRNTTGLVVKINYHPVNYEKDGLLVKQPISFQAGLFFGPRIGKKRKRSH
jgi:hypothetical protein